MAEPQHLLARLDAIGESLARSGHALALLSLGSVVLETARIDAYSDLDFFASFAQGYERTPESARALLAFLDAHFEVNAAIKAEIERLVAFGG
jgi:hypothetical protein